VGVNASAARHGGGGLERQLGCGNHLHFSVCQSGFAGFDGFPRAG
jgi:hypothetical protein